MRQVGKDVQNQHELPPRLFLSGSLRTTFFLLVTISRARENVTSYGITY